MVRDKLNAGRAIPLRRLLPLKEYPNDIDSVMSLYAEGFSVTDFLVNQSSRPEFLKFIADGMYSGWDEAAKAHYQYENVNALEEAWLAQLRKTKKQRTGTLAGNTEPADVEPTGRVVERRTSPPVQPLSDDPRPTFRGQSPAELDPPDDRYRDRTSRPGYLPETTPSSSKRTDPSGIRLGAPDSSPFPTTQLGQPIPASSTHGYAR